LEYAQRTVSRVETLLPLEPMDVAIMRNPWQVIPSTGVGGTAPTAHTILVSLEPNTERFSEQLEIEFCATLAHELHHTMRYHNPGAMKNLADALVWEGLAQHFEKEFRNHQVPPYATPEDPSRMNELLELAKLEFDAPLDYTGWFFGIPSRHIPFWTGYALGFEVMRRYFERTNETAATAWHVPTKTVFETLEA
jgi:uncharacterized protein YjaZ